MKLYKSNIFFLSLFIFYICQYGFALEPSFRLPAGGRAIAGPVVDIFAKLPTIWMVSEDGFLYGITEEAKLLTRAAMKHRPDSNLIVDPFERVVLFFSGKYIEVWTQAATLAWRYDLEGQGSSAISKATKKPEIGPVFGSDGRFFIVSGQKLVCLNPAGRQLWEYKLSAYPSSPPSIDGLGRPVLGLENGSVILLDQYGSLVVEIKTKTRPSIISPLFWNKDTWDIIQSKSSSESQQGTEKNITNSEIEKARASSTSLPVLALSSSEGSVFFYDDFGNLVFDTKFSKEIISMVWSNDVLFLLDNSGKIMAIGGDSKIKWEAQSSISNGKLVAFSEKIVAVGENKAMSFYPNGKKSKELSLEKSLKQTSINRKSIIGAVSPKGLFVMPADDWILTAYYFDKDIGLTKPLLLHNYDALPDLGSDFVFQSGTDVNIDSQLKRLADIDDLITKGQVAGYEPWAAAFCNAAIKGLFFQDLSENDQRRRSSALVKTRAISILGKLGSPIYREIITDVLKNENDGVYLAAACIALGDVGVDPDGKTASAFLIAASKPVDEASALAIITATEKLATGSGKTPRPEALQAIIRLSQFPYGSIVRERAKKALLNMANLK